MGTDASGIVEVLTDDGVWVPQVSRIWPSGRYPHEGRHPFETAVYLPRNYLLFSVLADVRNGTLRRGTVTMKREVEGYGELEFEYNMDDGKHPPIAYIDAPRGVPENASSLWLAYINSQGEDIHDPTWLTLREILDGPWDRPTKRSGVISEEEYIVWQETGKLPETMADNAAGEGLRIVTPDEYAAGVRGEWTTVVDFEYDVDCIRDHIGVVWWAQTEMMRMVAPNRDPERVRLLLAFDS